MFWRFNVWLAVICIQVFCGSSIGRSQDWDADWDALTTTQEKEAGTSPDKHDTDGDGLWDCWEVNRKVLGEPLFSYALDGRTKVYPDPNKKDLFVEFDSFKGIALTADEKKYLQEKVVAAFKKHDIQLHILWDEDDVEYDNSDRVLSESRWLNGALTRNSHSRKLSHRHCLLALQLKGGVLGWGAAEGNFILSSDFRDPRYNGNVTLAALFMHELGHTLSLDHGGFVGTWPFGSIMLGHGKNNPVHLSVMSYNWSVIGLRRVVDGVPVTVFDYQSFDMPSSISEKNIDESRGLRLPRPIPDHLRGFYTRSRKKGQNYLTYKDSPEVNDPKCGRLVLIDGPIDWNGNGSDTDIIQNQSLDGDMHRNETHKATFEEWSRLDYKHTTIGSIPEYERKLLESYSNVLVTCGTRLEDMKSVLPYDSAKVFAYVGMHCKSNSNDCPDGKFIRDGTHFISHALKAGRVCVNPTHLIKPCDSGLCVFPKHLYASFQTSSRQYSNVEELDGYKDTLKGDFCFFTKVGREHVVLLNNTAKQNGAEIFGHSRDRCGEFVKFDATDSKSCKFFRIEDSP